MTTFHQVQYRCPHCGKRMQSYEIASYYVHDSILYSDGKTECNPPLAGLKPFALCYFCNQAFWKETSISLIENVCFETEKIPEPKEIPELFSYKNADSHLSEIKLYIQLIKEGFASTVAEEIYLRMQLWWLFNDPFRNNPCFSLNGLFKRMQRIWQSGKSVEFILLRKTHFNGNLKALLEVLT